MTTEMIRKTNAGNRRLPCRLTTQEKSSKTRELLGCIGDLKDLDRRLDDAQAIVKHLKDERKTEAGRRDTIANIINKGQEDRSVEFDLVLDYDKKRVIEIRNDTENVIGVREMRDSERERVLPFVGDQLQDPDKLNRAVVLFFNKQGRADRAEIGGTQDDEDVEQDLATRIKAKVNGWIPAADLDEIFEDVDGYRSVLWALLHTGEIDETSDEGTNGYCEYSPGLALDVMAMLEAQPGIGTEEGLLDGEIVEIPLDDESDEEMDPEADGEVEPQPTE